MNLSHVDRILLVVFTAAVFILCVILISVVVVDVVVGHEDEVIGVFGAVVEFHAFVVFDFVEGGDRFGLQGFVVDLEFF